MSKPNALISAEDAATFRIRLANARRARHGVIAAEGLDVTRRGA